MANELSTIGVTFGYAVETTAGTRPTSFTNFSDITSIGEITGEPETIEVTNLLDTWHRYIEGLKDSGESVPIGANFTKAFLSAWTAARAAALTAKGEGKACWWEVGVSGFGNFYFAGIPAEVGLPAIGVGEAFAGEVNITINDIAGWTAES